jgi:hypothetical protein
MAVISLSLVSMAMKKLSLLLVACAILSGCNPSNPHQIVEVVGTPLTGKVLEGGKPIKTIRSEVIQVIFISVEGNGKYAGLAEVAKDGTFVNKGPSGKGLPAGKWKITLSSTGPGIEDDRFAANYGYDSTPFTVDITTEAQQHFEIDLATGKVNKTTKP